MAKIKFSDNKNTGFKWFTNKNIFVKGAFYDRSNNYYEKEHLISYFEGIESIEDFHEKLKNANGMFSVVVQKEKETWVAVDRNISFPIFYIKDNEDYIITDENGLNKSVAIDETQKNIYESLGHTFGKATLFNNVFQVQCAEALCIKENCDSSYFYHQFAVSKFQTDTFDNLYSKGIQLFNKSSARLIQSLNGRTAVIPLSGGYDSRLIAAGLKKHGYENVICFTYGKQKNNPELELSKSVAEKLGYKWLFVEYTNELFGMYNESQEFHKYVRYMSHGSSMFYLQEYFAVKYLKENKLIPNDAIFIPGHSGDLIGGSQLIKVFDKDISKNKIAPVYLQKKAIYAKLNEQAKKLLTSSITNTINSDCVPVTICEELDIQEKISKVIFNSSLVFDFFGYEKRFPFWDTELLDFFLSIPLQFREMKHLYDSILENEYFAFFDINFKKEIQPSKRNLEIQRIKNSIKSQLPKKYKLRLLKKSDWKNYHDATLILRNEMKNSNFKFSFSSKSYNEILIQYYLYLFYQHDAK